MPEKLCSYVASGILTDFNPAQWEVKPSKDQEVYLAAEA